MKIFDISDYEDSAKSWSGAECDSEDNSGSDHDEDNDIVDVPRYT